MAYLVNGDYYTGLYFSFNLLRTEVTGDLTGFQHTVQPAAVLQTLNTLLKKEILVNIKLTSQMYYISIGYTVKMIWIICFTHNGV